jgi:molybdenum cofactor cytidylyltransferase
VSDHRFPVGAVILAAGSASRMGRVKQLLPYRGRTLIEHAIEQAHRAGFAPVVVVLGAQAEAVGQVVSTTLGTPVLNANWASGMGSSIAAGVAGILELAPKIAAIAVLLADQPYVLASHLADMSRVFEAGSAPILAASYAGTLGVPALFHQAVFDKLRNLKPDAGARALLRGGADQVHSFELPEAATDIDTPEEFANLT